MARQKNALRGHFIAPLIQRLNQKKQLTWNWQNGSLT